MTETTQSDGLNFFQQMIEEDARTKAAAPAVNSANKAAIFAGMAQAAISRIIACFDGSGDDGAVREIQYFRGDEQLESEPVTPATIAVQSARSWRNGPGDLVDLPTAIEYVTDELIDQHHAGWENNEGGQGEAIFDADAGTITLSIGLNYTQTDDHRYEF